MHQTPIPSDALEPSPDQVKVEQLLPCPFCGGEAGTDDKGMAGQEDWCRHYSVACSDCCGDCGWHSTEAEAVAAWNRRASLTPPANSTGLREAHTPGPWSFDGPPDNIIVWSGPEERVCFMASNGPAEANAQLIAAAPELLRAAELMIDAHETDNLGLVTEAIGELVHARGLARGKI